MSEILVPIDGSPLAYRASMTGFTDASLSMQWVYRPATQATAFIDASRSQHRAARHERRQQKHEGHHPGHQLAREIQHGLPRVHGQEQPGGATPQPLFLQPHAARVVDIDTEQDARQDALEHVPGTVSGGE